MVYEIMVYEMWCMWYYVQKKLDIPKSKLKTSLERRLLSALLTSVNNLRFSFFKSSNGIEAVNYTNILSMNAKSIRSYQSTAIFSARARSINSNTTICIRTLCLGRNNSSNCRKRNDRNFPKKGQYRQTAPGKKTVVSARAHVSFKKIGTLCLKTTSQI